MIRTYTKQAIAKRCKIFTGMIVLAWSVIGLICTTLLFLHGLLLFSAATLCGMYAVAWHLQKFKNLKGACILCENGKVERYFTEDAYAHSRDLRGVTVRVVDNKPIGMSRSITYAKGGQVVRRSIDVSCFPDIGNLQAYANTHWGMYEDIDNVIVRHILDSFLLAMSCGMFCEECAREQMEAKLHPHGLALGWMSISEKEDEYFLT